MTGDRFSCPLPLGYGEGNATPQKKVGTVVLAAKTVRMNHRPTITIQRAPIPGGTMAMPDPTAACFKTGASMATGVNAWTGPAVTSNAQGTLKRASIIDGPAGKTCQIHFIAPEGVALITELNRPDGTETWIITCNHADGDTLSEDICRVTLAGFRFTK